jgi:hypothetical protein
MLLMLSYSRSVWKFCCAVNARDSRLRFSSRICTRVLKTLNLLMGWLIVQQLNYELMQLMVVVVEIALECSSLRFTSLHFMTLTQP